MKTKIKMIMLGFFLSCGISSAQGFEYTLERFHSDLVRLDEGIDDAFEAAQEWKIENNDPQLVDIRGKVRFLLFLARLSFDTGDFFSGDYFISTMGEMNSLADLLLAGTRNQNTSDENYEILGGIRSQMFDFFEASRSLANQQRRGRIAQFSWLGKL